MGKDTLLELTAIIFASTGFWAFLSSMFQSFIAKRDRTKETVEAIADMSKGLGHDRIVSLGKMYLKRGSITSAEYRSLHDYLYMPYKRLNGDGTAETIMNAVNQLLIKEGSVNNENPE